MSELKQEIEDLRNSLDDLRGKKEPIIQWDPAKSASDNLTSIWVRFFNSFKVAAIAVLVLAGVWIFLGQINVRQQVVTSAWSFILTNGGFYEAIAADLRLEEEVSDQVSSFEEGSEIDGPQLVYSNEAAKAVLEIVRTDVDRKQVLKLDKQLVRYISDEALDKESDLRRAVLKLVDADLKKQKISREASESSSDNSPAINLPDILIGMKDNIEFAEKFFETRHVVNALNAHSEELGFLKDRVALAFRESGKVKMIKGFKPEAVIAFPNFQGNTVEVHCQFDVEGHFIPERIDFFLNSEILMDSFYWNSRSVSVGDPKKSFSHTVLIGREKAKRNELDGEVVDQKQGMTSTINIVFPDLDEQIRTPFYTQKRDEIGQLLEDMRQLEAKLRANGLRPVEKKALSDELQAVEGAYEFARSDLESFDQNASVRWECYTYLVGDVLSALK